MKSNGNRLEDDPYCTDCKWLLTRVNFDRGSNYTCAKQRLASDEPLLWRRPCNDFTPSDGAISNG